MNTMTEAVNDVKARDQYQSWLMRHGHHWNDIRTQTFDASLAADHAVAVTLNGLGADAAYWAAPGATDWAHGEALFMEFERLQDEAIAINVRLDALAVTQDAELARFGVNIFDVEGLGYEALHLMRAEAVELDVFRTEVARHLSGVELDRAVSEYARDLAERPRCVACLSVDVHPVDCPFHPAVLEEARANVLARTSQDITPEGLDLYADYLRSTAASR